MDSATVPDVRRRTSAHGLGAERRPGLRTGLPKLQLQLEGPAPGRDLGESRAAAPATPPRLAVPGDLRELSVPQMGLKKIKEQRDKSACLQPASHKIVAGLNRPFPLPCAKSTTAVACGGSPRMPCNASVPSWIVTRDSMADPIGCIIQLWVERDVSIGPASGRVRFSV